MKLSDALAMIVLNIIANAVFLALTKAVYYVL